MKLNFVRRGAGKPLLLIHGLGGSRRSWQTIIDRLATERDVIAVDLPGFGATPPLDGEVSIRTLADALRFLFEIQNDFFEPQRRYFRARRGLNADWRMRSAADFRQLFSVFLHNLIIFQPFLNVAQNPRRVFVFRCDDAVMRPNSVAPGGDDTGFSQIREVSRNLRLVRSDNLDEIAHADFGFAH